MSIKETNSEAESFARILPLEVISDSSGKTGGKRALTRQWQADKSGRFFSTNLSGEQLKTALTKAKVKLENVSLNSEAGFICYHYKGKPLIKLNLNNGQFYALKSEIDLFGKEAVQNQANILLNVLKQNGFSTATKRPAFSGANSKQTLKQLETYQKEP
ncbi:MAG: hypothetical protein ACQXXJ_02780 [Candidatus Bathyarchaeia archaeon]